MEISNMERYFLINQFTILSKLYEQNDEYLSEKYQNAVDGLNMGVSFEWATQDLPGFDEDNISKDTEDRVIKVLNMYDFIYSTCTDLSTEEKLKSKDALNFVGFDGNSNDGALAFCNFVIDKLKRYQSVKNYIESNGQSFNNHGGFNPGLDSMLERYESTKDIRDHKERLKKILDI